MILKQRDHAQDGHNFLTFSSVLRWFPFGGCSWFLLAIKISICAKNKKKKQRGHGLKNRVRSNLPNNMHVATNVRLILKRFAMSTWMHHIKN